MFCFASCLRTLFGFKTETTANAFCGFSDSSELFETCGFLAGGGKVVGTFLVGNIRVYIITVYFIFL